MRHFIKFISMAVLLGGASVNAAGNKGEISGTIMGSLTGASSLDSVIKGASVVFYSGGVKIDSVVTNSSGIFSDSLTAGTYFPIKISAAGFKSDSDLPALDTSATVSSSSSTNINAVLITASASLGGIFTDTIEGLNQPVGGAKLFLQRRATNILPTATVYWKVDSTTTNSNGLYDFVNMIAGPIANYRILIKDSAYSLYDSSANTTVTAGESLTLNLEFGFQPIPIQPLSPLQSSLSFHQSPSFLSFTLPNTFSNPSSAAIFNLSGDRLIESPISKSNFSMPIGNLGMGKYYLEVKDAKDKIVEPFEISK